MNQAKIVPTASTHTSSLLDIALTIFVVVVLLVWVILQFNAPKFAQRKGPDGKVTGKIDTHFTLLIAIFVGILSALLAATIAFWNGK